MVLVAYEAEFHGSRVLICMLLLEGRTETALARTIVSAIYLIRMELVFSKQ